MRSPKEETEQHRRMSKNTIVQPKTNRKTGFTQWNVSNRALIKDHVAAFLAKPGNEIDHAPVNNWCNKNTQATALNY